MRTALIGRGFLAGSGFLGGSRLTAVFRAAAARAGDLRPTAAARLALAGRFFFTERLFMEPTISSNLRTEQKILCFQCPFREVSRRILKIQKYISYQIDMPMFYETLRTRSNQA
jgi:hypothetical protein